MPELNADSLLNLGFRDVAFWTLKEGRLKYEFDGERASQNEELFSINNVLYAFVEGDEVRYIGKTTQSLRSRFAGYCAPSVRQSTNIKNNNNLREIINRNIMPRIFVFTPISLLSYGDFPLNLAAGLEDSLVSRFAPAWNGPSPGRRVTETAELEEEALNDNVTITTPDQPTPMPAAEPKHHTFTIILGPTYYNQGMINPGSDASLYLGPHGDPISVTFSDGAQEITSGINRTANPNGSVRIVGSNRLISDWFKEHFTEGNTVRASVLNPHCIMLFAPND